MNEQAFLTEDVGLLFKGIIIALTLFVLVGAWRKGASGKAIAILLLIGAFSISMYANNRLDTLLLTGQSISIRLGVSYAICRNIGTGANLFVVFGIIWFAIRMLLGFGGAANNVDGAGIQYRKLPDRSRNFQIGLGYTQPAKPEERALKVINSDYD